MDDARPAGPLSVSMLGGNMVEQQGGRGGGRSMYVPLAAVSIRASPSRGGKRSLQEKTVMTT